MIQLVFAVNREILNFLVKEREIFYTDRKWRSWIRCLPPPKNLIQTVKMSRNRIPPFIADLFTFNDEEMEEYESAKTEREIADIIIKDAKLKGCKIVKDQEVKEGEQK